MNILKALIFSCCAICLPLSFEAAHIVPVYADTVIAPIQPGDGITTPYTGGCKGTVPGNVCHSEESFIGSIFAKILKIALLLGGILATLFIVYNGIQYILSAGDAAKTKVARGNILNILIGIVIIVTSYSIIYFAQTVGGFATSL